MPSLFPGAYTSIPGETLLIHPGTFGGLPSVTQEALNTLGIEVRVSELAQPDRIYYLSGLNQIREVSIHLELAPEPPEPKGYWDLVAEDLF